MTTAISHRSVRFSNLFLIFLLLPLSTCASSNDCRLKLPHSRLASKKYDILREHTIERNDVDPSAKDMSTLNWDVGLARHAQLTAEENLVAIVQGIHKEMMEKKEKKEKWVDPEGKEWADPENKFDLLYRDWRQREVDMDWAVRRPDGKPFHKAFGDTWVGENMALFREKNDRLENGIWRYDDALTAWFKKTGYTYGCHGKQTYDLTDEKYPQQDSSNAWARPLEQVAEQYLQLIWANTSDIGCGVANGMFKEVEERNGKKTWQLETAECPRTSTCHFVTLIVCHYWPGAKIGDIKRDGKRPYLANCDECPQCWECCADKRKSGADFARPTSAVVMAAALIIRWAITL